MKQIKRISAIILAVVMLFSLASCSLVNTSETDITNDNIKIGVILKGTKDSTDGTSGICNVSINQLTNLGYGIKADRFKYAENVDPSDENSVAAAYKTLINYECNMIIVSDYAFAAYTEKVAEENPGVLFLLYNGTGNGKNIIGYTANVTAAAYLSGIAAGAKAAELKNDNIGYVINSDKNYTVVNSFFEGVRSVNGDATVSAVIKSDDDAADANKLIEKDCKVIASDFYSEAIANTAKESGTFFCGFGSEPANIDEFSEVYLCSPLYSFTQFFVDTVKTLVDFEMPEDAPADAKALSYIIEQGLVGDYNGGIKTGATYLSALNAVAEGTDKAVQEALYNILNGTLSFTVSASQTVDGITVIK